MERARRKCARVAGGGVSRPLGTRGSRAVPTPGVGSPDAPRAKGGAPAATLDGVVARVAALARRAARLRHDLTHHDHVGTDTERDLRNAHISEHRALWAKVEALESRVAARVSRRR